MLGADVVRDKQRNALEFRRAHQDIILLNKAIKRDKSVNSQFILMDFEEVLQ